MENNDRARILKMIETDIRLRRLYKEHEDLQETLAKYEHRGFLTSEEEVAVKGLKMKKLTGVEQMMEIISKAA